MAGLIDYPIVCVRWADAHCGDAGWVDLEDWEDDGECLVTTVGFMIPQGEPGAKAKHVTIVQTYMDGDVIHPFYIPADMVRTITLLQHPLEALT